jgi:flagellar protein FliS
MEEDGMIEVQVNESGEDSAVGRVVRLYHGAIGFAQAARESEDPEERLHWVARSVAILDALQSHLDREAGGEIAANLSDLYDFARSRLLEPEPGGFERRVAEATGVLEQLASAWEELALQPATAS